MKTNSRVYEVNKTVIIRAQYEYASGLCGKQIKNKL